MTKYGMACDTCHCVHGPGVARMPRDSLYRPMARVARARAQGCMNCRSGRLTYRVALA
jgi:hypothetical protein